MMENTEWKDTEVGKIPIDWNIFKLKEKVDVIMGQSPSSNFYNKNKIGLPFMQGRTTFGDKHHTINMWTSEVKRIAIKDSVLMSVRAPVGDLNIAINELCIGRGLASLNMKNGNNEFLFYLLRAYRDQILNKETGTVFGSINKSGIENLELPFPPFLEQKKIAAILKSLDDKIELNNKMNETLEEMAQTIFKEWFVNFNFPNEEGKPYKDNGGKMIESELGMIPEGWRVKKLESFILDTIGGEWGKEQQDEKHIVPIYSIRGTDIPQIKKGNRGNTPKRFIKEASFDKKHLKIGDLIIEISGGSPTQSTGRVSYISKEILEKFSKMLTCTNFCRSIRLKETKDSNLIYQFLERLYRNDIFFQYENGTTGIKNLDLKSVFSSEKIAYPINLEVINNFNYIIGGLYRTIQEKGNQNESLIKTRDILLPKLMSGEIKV